MTDTEVAQAPPLIEEKVVAKTDSPKKVKEVKAKKPAAKPTHPSAGDMVTAAVKTLAERNGSSLQAIKKYIAANYKVEIEKQAPFIKKFLKSAVEKGTLVQTKGKGASGSFKLAVVKAVAKPKPKAVTGEKKAVVKKPATKKTTDAKISVKKATAPKKSAAKKPASPKKAKAPAKPKAAAEPKAKKAAVAPKSKKAAKAPTAKPKAPKPKKVAAPNATKSPAKKAAAKK